MRNLSIDILRGVALIWMVLSHFVEHLSPAGGTHPILYGAVLIVAGISAPLFCLLAGLGYSLWLRKQRSLGRSESDLDKISIRRGLLIFGIGATLSFFLWLPAEMFPWDILTLLGAALTLLAVMRRLSVRALFIVCVAVFLVSPPLRVLSGYSEHWFGGEYRYAMTLTDILLGFLLNGYFPLLPWLLFPLVGFVVGERIYGEGTTGAGVGRRLVVAGGAVFVAGIAVRFLLGVVPEPVAQYVGPGHNFYPATASFILLNLGGSLAALGYLHDWYDAAPGTRSPGPVARFLKRYGTFALSAYVAHDVAHVVPLYAYGWAMGHEQVTYYWTRAVSAPVALVLAGVFLLLFYGVILLLERHRRWSLEAGLRWLVD